MKLMHMSAIAVWQKYTLKGDICEECQAEENSTLAMTRNRAEFFQPQLLSDHRARLVTVQLQGACL